MKTQILAGTVLVSFYLALTACVNDTGSQGNDHLSGDKNHAKPNEDTDVPMPMNLNTQIAIARTDLADRLGVDIESVKLSGAKTVTWRSGALGCPEPGMSYTEALVPGSVIYLQTDNMLYAYHAKFAEEPFYCPRERVESPVIDSQSDQT